MLDRLLNLGCLGQLGSDKFKSDEGSHFGKKIKVK